MSVISITIPSGVAQSYLGVVVSVAYLVVTARIRPWRRHKQRLWRLEIPDSANNIAITGSVTHIVVIVLGLAMVHSSARVIRWLAGIAAAVSSLCSVLMTTAWVQHQLGKRSVKAAIQRAGLDAEDLARRLIAERKWDEARVIVARVGAGQRMETSM